MNELTLILLTLTCLMALLDWRRGLVLCLVMGALQDPLRKLAPGQPVYYVVLVGVIFGTAWVRAALMRVPLSPAAIHGWNRYLKTPFTVFLFIVIAQALHSYFRFGSMVVPGIGLLVWLAPIPAVMLAYQFAIRRGLTGVRRWMIIYIGVTLAALSGVYLEYIGLDWRSLGEIGEGQIIYDVGLALKAHSGFYRASEIAAWHTAAVACLAFTLSMGKRPTLMRVGGALLLTTIIVGLGMLTGRRKLLVEITIFVTSYLFLIAWLQRGMARLAVTVLVIGFVGYVAVVGFMAPDLVRDSYTKSMKIDESQRLEGYALRGQSVFADLPKRVNNIGWQPLVWAVDQFGWLGAGLGTGSQGTNDIVEAHNIDRWGAEGGLGKIAMELGVPGLLVAVWLLRAMGRHLHQELTTIARHSPKHARLAFGFLSFLIANLATFSVATQAFSDLFILLILGWSLGFLFAMPVLAAREAQQASRLATPPWEWRRGLSPAGLSHPGAQARR